jgi:Domain of unknown function (DUF4190)
VNVSYPPQAQYQQYGPPSYGPPAGPPPKQGAGLAIASMVLGIIALLLSWIPIINNVAAIIAVVGLGLGIPALIRARRGTHNGTGMAITGLVTSVLAIVLVILTQMLFVKAIDEVESSINESLAEVEAAPVDPGAEEAVAETAEAVALGVPAQVGDYEVTVDAVELDANETVAGANDWNEPPTGQYVIAQLTVTYTGAEEGMPGFDLTAIFHGTDSRQYSDTECSAVLPDDAMDAPTLNSGGSDTFQFCMDVQPTAIQGGQLSIEPTLSFDDERVFFAIG